MANISRRSLLRSGAALAATSIASRANAQAVALRPSVNSLAWDDPILVSYRTAILAMQALPPSDPRNWTRQAQIHQGNNVVRCPHGNWYFLPWHRAYLHAFEKICQQLSNNSNFALPFWDWTANPQLPANFANPTLPNGQPNALFNQTRNSQTVTIPSNVAGNLVISQILAEPSFEVFGSSRPRGQDSTDMSWLIRQGDTGQLESQPHNSVHGRVGGNMATFMSPLDPIFWLHHCNIDRIWDQWNRMKRANSKDPLWRDFMFAKQFVLPSGAGTAPYDPKISDLLAIDALGYAYTPPSIQPAQSLLQLQPLPAGALGKTTRLDKIPPARVNVPLNMAVALPDAQILGLQRIRPLVIPLNTTVLEPVRAEGRVVAVLRDVTPPTSGNAEVRVFVNCPYLEPDTPPQDQHYASSFSFFGSEHAGHDGKPSYLIDLTATVRRLSVSESRIKNEVNVQLMPVPIPGAASAEVQFQVGSVEIAVV